LYWVLLASVELRDAPWIFWVTDLAAPDPWFILPILMIITMVIQFKLNPTPPDPVQAKMMAIMPFVFGIMFIFFGDKLTGVEQTTSVMFDPSKIYSPDEALMHIPFVYHTNEEKVMMEQLLISSFPDLGGMNS